MGLTLLGGVSYLDHLTKKKNKKYAQNNKNPDFELAKWKIAAGLAILSYTECKADKGYQLKKGPPGTSEKLKYALRRAVFFSACITFASDAVGNILRKFPLLGGFLVDPLIKDGKEQKHIGALLRFFIPYAAIRTTTGIHDFC